MRRALILVLAGLPALTLGQTPGAAPPAAAAAAPVADGKASAAVSRFVMGTRLGYITCSEQYKGYLEKMELYSLVTEGQRAPQGTPPSDSAVADCVHQTALRGSSLYKDAVKDAGTPKAKSAFSEYMVAWDAALKGIRRSERETVQQYRARQKAVEDKLNALQSRLEAAVPGA
jgi:hypothetical protein